MGDLSVTALYTSATWSWGGLPHADLVEHPDAKRVFRAVNGALALARPFLAASTDAPLPVALLHRHAFIDALLRSARPARVLELAAGLSRRGVTWSADPGVEYVEVDQPHVIETKRALLARTPEGRAALERPNFRLVGADALTEPLDALMPRDGRSLTIVAEGLMMYLQADAQKALAEKVASRLSDGGGLFVFDLVPPGEQPKPTAVGRGLGWIMKRFTGGQGFVPDTRTREQLVDGLRAIGFVDVEAVEPRTVARAWSLPHPDAPTRQLVFVSRVRT